MNWLLPILIIVTGCIVAWDLYRAQAESYEAQTFERQDPKDLQADLDYASDQLRYRMSLEVAERAGNRCADYQRWRVKFRELEHAKCMDRWRWMFADDGEAS